MSEFETGYILLDEKFGNGKDNLIALATVAREPGKNGVPRPVVRVVDAIYVDGVFYISTNSKSNKVLQIEQNQEVSVASSVEMFTANGIGENLGWVMKPENAELRAKIRAAFPWYEEVTNEKDENNCILAIRLTKGTLNINHWEKLYFMDFINKKDMENGGIF